MSSLPTKGVQGQPRLRDPITPAPQDKNGKLLPIGEII